MRIIIKCIRAAKLTLFALDEETGLGANSTVIVGVAVGVVVLFLVILLMVLVVIRKRQQRSNMMLDEFGSVQTLV